MATPGSPRVADQVGRVLGDRYRLAAPIGTGASATVYVADDLRLGRRVAVKVLHPGLAADDIFLRRFRAEARAAASLSHPNIMAVYDWGDEEVPYLVLELLSGGSLRSILTGDQRLSLSQALMVGIEAARALDAAHRAGFVHRDVKPANLLFGEDGRLRIADFGLARALSETGWTDHRDGLVGTARYAAPEQASSGGVDGKADVYALGLVLVEAVTGSVPGLGDSVLATIRSRVEEPVPVPDEMRELKPILERVLQPDPNLRPDADELVHALHDAARHFDRPAPLPLVGIGTIDDGGDHSVSGDTELPTRAVADPTVHGAALAPVQPRRRWWRVVVAVLVVVATVAGVLLLWQASKAPTAVVPDVAGQSEDDARAAIAAALAAGDDEVEWELAVDEEYSDGVESGVVIRTDPPATDDLEDGSTLTLVVSQGPEPVPVPDLFNYLEAEARTILEDAELDVGEIIEVFSEEVAAGRIVSWGTADAGDRPSEIPKGTAVDLQLSKGPEPRTIERYAGASPDEAKAELESKGLVVALAEEFSEDVPAGQVTRTDPPEGATVERGATVTVYVSKGPDLVAVPDVIGMKLDEATDRLEAAGFSVSAEGPTRGEVFETDPGPGERVRRGAEVTIYLRR